MTIEPYDTVWSGHSWRAVPPPVLVETPSGRSPVLLPSPSRVSDVARARVLAMLSSDIWWSAIEIQIGCGYSVGLTWAALRSLLDDGLIERRPHRWGAGRGSGCQGFSYRRVLAREQAA